MKDECVRLGVANSRMKGWGVGLRVEAWECTRGCDCLAPPYTCRCTLLIRKRSSPEETPRTLNIGLR